MKFGMQISVYAMWLELLLNICMYIHIYVYTYAKQYFTIIKQSIRVIVFGFSIHIDKNCMHLFVKFQSN